MAQLTKRLLERAIEVELTHHLGYEPHLEPPGGGEHAQRFDAEDACERAWAGCDPHAAGSRQQL